MSGKAYANKKTLEERNKNEYYPTPKVLVVELEKLNLINKTDKVLEHCCGEAKQISGYFKEVNKKSPCFSWGMNCFFFLTNNIW